MTLPQTVRLALAKHLQDPDSKSYVVAYSGGVDSHALLQCCVDNGLRVRAIHVDHNLQAQSKDWMVHCGEVCDALGVDLTCFGVNFELAPGVSPEAAARESRYDVLLNHTHEDEILLLAQHRDDQAETVLLQLLRGGGPAGLSAMPEDCLRCNDDGNSIRLMRPLLGVTREHIEAFARERQLQWVEDPSNDDTEIDRNAVRHRLMPLLHEMSPAAGRQLARVAMQQQRTAGLLDELAQIDLAHCATVRAQQLKLDCLTTLSYDRQFNLLRHWLHALDTSPNRKALQQIISDVLPAGDDAMPCVSWAGHQLRRYGNSIYLLRDEEIEWPETPCEWTPRLSLELDSGRTLTARRDVSQGLHNRLLDERLHVAFRQGGERIRLRGKQHSQELKKLFQQAGVPPWERDRLPLLYLDEELVAAGSEWLADAYCVPRGETGWKPVILCRSGF